MVPVRELADQIRGVTYERGDVVTQNDPAAVGVARAGNIQDGNLNLDEDLVFIPSSKVDDRQLLKEDDVMIAMSSGSLGVVGKAARCRESTSVAFGAFCQVLRPRPNVNPSYFAHYFQTTQYRRQVRRVAAGANINNLRNEDIASIRIPLPSLEEQRLIAAILDKADELRSKRRAAINHLDTLAQAIFLDMFGDAFDKEKPWPTTRLGDLTTKIGSGATPRGGKASYRSTGTALIRSMNIHDGKFLRKDLAFLDSQQAWQLRHVEVEPHDVMFNITGASVARVCRVPKDVLPARVNQHVAILRPGDQLTPTYLESLLMSPSMKANLLRIGRSSGATREAITKAQLEGFEMPLPPMHIQREFDKRVQEIEGQRHTHSSSSASLTMLFRSLQALAFRGEL